MFLSSCRSAASSLQAGAFCGSWQVSSHGRVRSAAGRVTYGSLTYSGYRCLTIENKPCLVHRLVAAAFLGQPPCPKAWIVNHLDGDPSNNHANNLQYVTPAENQRHSFATNASRQRGAAKLGKAVLWRPYGERTWSFCSSAAEAATLLGVHKSCISLCCNGRIRKTAGNGIWYEFKFAVADEQPDYKGEIWQPSQYPGRDGVIKDLLASSHGRVWSKTPAENTLKTFGTRLNTGYYAVTKGGRCLLVHRLVAATFLGQPEFPNLLVNHKDLDRENNSLQNLEYVTPAQNTRHAASLQRAGQGAKATSGKAVCARLKESKGAGLSFCSIAAAAAHTGIDRQKISRICNGDASTESWEFTFAGQKVLPGEEWRPMILEGVRRA